MDENNLFTKVLDILLNIIKMKIPFGILILILALIALIFWEAKPWIQHYLEIQEQKIALQKEILEHYLQNKTLPKKIKYGEDGLEIEK